MSNDTTPFAQTASNELLARKIADFITEDDLAKIHRSVEEIKKLMTYYRCAILEVETKLKVLNEQFSLEHERNPIESIKSRLKSPESIRDKIVRKGIPFTVESIEQNLFDIAGVRVICSFVDDIYMLADCLTGQDDVRLITKKDYIRNPKENGYRSMHLIIEIPIFLQNEKRFMKVEVQLRTIAMEFWANLEHKLRYKKNLSPELMAVTAQELSECASLSATLDSKMQAVKDTIESGIATFDEE